ncbi:MAG: MFS transporter [Phycisphaerales bacterium]|nr:MAG: MFS transporter [Phycisphaerales bacterium]
MNEPTADTPKKLGWRFPPTFWIANAAELFERAAFYGMFIALVVYLTRDVHFTDKEAAVVAGCFGSVLYLVPTFMGAMADRIGFRRALMLAFALLTVGYALLGAFQLKSTVIVALSLIILGGAIVKPVISGTVAQCSDEDHRPRAFSIFYGVVNIGSFIGKSAAAPLRQELGLEYINYYASAMAFCAFVCIALFYRNVKTEGVGKSLQESWDGFKKVIKHFRFMCLIVIVAGFWFIQGQLYATMSKYMLRLLGEGAKPEWLANINPFVVVVLVVPITHLIRKFKPENAIAIGLLIIPLSALTIALTPFVEEASGSSITLFGNVSLHPLTLMVILGIGLQGVAECFLSPKFLEYASKQAPPGEIGLYLGYQHLTTCIAWLFGFIASGFLLDAYCPDPTTLDPAVQQQRLDAIANGTPLPDVFANAHYIWFAYAGVGIAAFCAILVFKFVTDAIDRRREATELAA